MSENNGGRKAYYDFYRLAELSNNYSEDELSEFKFFDKSLIRSVKPDELLLVRKVLNPKRSEVRVLDEGLHILDPFFEESIKIPNPSNPIVINYKPKDENDRRENFIFVPNLVSTDETSERDEIYCDYKVSIRIYDPIQYFYSANALENLRAAIVGVLREFIASKAKKEIITNFSKYKIEDIDTSGVLKEFKTKYGLEVVSVGFDSVKESREVQDARNKIAVERQNIEKEKAIKERKKIEAEGNKQVKDIETLADVNRYRSLATTLGDQGLSTEDIAILLGISMRGDAIKTLRDSDKANVFVSMDNMGGMINPMMYFARHGEKTSSSSKIIEAANDMEDNEEEKNGSYVRTLKNEKK